MFEYDGPCFWLMLEVHDGPTGGGESGFVWAVEIADDNRNA